MYRDLSFKKSDFLKTKRKQKLEREIISLTQTDLSKSEDLISWVRNGLRYFHQLSYIDSKKVKKEMVMEIDGGLAVVLNERSYWLPKSGRLQNK